MESNGLFGVEAKWINFTIWLSYEVVILGGERKRIEILAGSIYQSSISLYVSTVYYVLIFGF